MSFSAYLSFNGQARDAMTTYAAIFGATDLQLMPFAQQVAARHPFTAIVPVSARQRCGPAGARDVTSRSTARTCASSPTSRTMRCSAAPNAAGS